MTKISAKVIADSWNITGNRITTMVVTFPRFILAELNTHRMMSRNSASSRAIPFEKMLDSVENNPFIPIAWQKDHSGMQGTEYFTEDYEVNYCIRRWQEAKERAIFSAKELHYSEITLHSNVTKQLCNRLLEPFMWHTVIVTATEWENFFALRCPKYSISAGYPSFRSRKDYVAYLGEKGTDTSNYSTLDWLKVNKGQAEIHMMELAEQMWDSMNESTPKELQPGEWHIPFGDNILISGTNGIEQNTIDTIKIATARCARVSYTVVGEEDKPANYENDIKLHDRLAASGHWSPFEHCAQCLQVTPDGVGVNGNFFGFQQYRKTFTNENITK